MIHKKILGSLSVRLQATAIFLSLVGVAFGYKTYKHVETQFGAEAGQVFYEDFLLQIAIALVVNVVVAVVLYNITTKPIKTLGEVMRAITENVLNLDVPYVTKATEIGSMARKVEIFKKNAIEKKKLEEQQAVNEIAAKSEKKKAMSELADRFNREVQNIIEDVIKDVGNVKLLSEHMSQAIQSTSRKAIAVAETVESTSQNINNMATSADQMSNMAREVENQISRSGEAVKLVVSANESANQVASMLENAMNKIGEIVTLIQSIAGQINLLALNATIESARAGEAGKGFAVVASEVKNLAGQTARATGDISTQIESIQSIARQVMGALASINSSVDHVDKAASSISSAIVQQTSSTSEIATNINHVATSAQQISVDIEAVKKDSLGASQCADESFKAVTSLQGSSDKLSKAVSLFLDEVRAA